PHHCRTQPLRHRARTTHASVNAMRGDRKPTKLHDLGKRATATYWGSSGLLLFDLAQPPRGSLPTSHHAGDQCPAFLTNSAALDTSTPPLATLYRPPIGADCRVLHCAAAVHD